MRLPIVLSILAVSIFAARGEDANSTPYYVGRINNSLVREPINDMIKPLFEPHFVGRAEFDECTDDSGKVEQLDTITRKDEFVVRIKCNDETLFAEFKTEAITQDEDLAEQPVLGTQGGYQTAAAFENKLFPWFEEIRGEGCTVIYEECAYQALYDSTTNTMVFKFTCPIVCGDTKTHPLFVFDMPRGVSTTELVGISDSPSLDGVDKLCLKNMKKIFDLSGSNSKVILHSLKEFTSELSDISVVAGSYLELHKGVQYCMHVRDESAKKDAVVAIYQFDIDDTTPFMSTLPWDNMSACEGFLKTVSCVWVASGGECAYD